MTHYPNARPIQGVEAADLLRDICAVIVADFTHVRLTMDELKRVDEAEVRLIRFVEESLRPLMRDDFERPEFLSGYTGSLKGPTGDIP